ncbi:DUF2171 domain-containing protein [Sphingomonas sp. BT553]|uniref:DUF2171 domain-containing protein n=2 Tax=Sphingomonas mollis TaxID=2795726 RepID=A0ABS0XNE3_9SPHN|nr:DUF2171 domain-containing protein [Sphingomonas sp. BT553]
MGYERYPRGTNPQGDYYNRTDPHDYGRDYGGGRDYSYSSARDYAAAGYDRDDDRSRDRYGRQEYGNQRYGQRDQFDRSRAGGGYGRRDEYHGSYASDGRRFEDVGRNRHADDDNRHDNRQRDRGYGRQPQGYEYEDRGFFARAGDEVRSWFGDDDAERRRELDSRYDDRGYRSGGGQHDEHYGSWRSSQIAALDRDYDEYRNENRSRFESEFSSWRNNRQTQRDSLNKVTEHQEVVGSDGGHIGTVDKVRGDRILLTKNDVDAGGQHHSIPSSWIKSVDDKVTLSKTADEAKQAWRDEDRNQAMFGYGDNARNRDDSRTTASASKSSADTGTGGNLNRSFSGTY